MLMIEVVHIFLKKCHFWGRIAHISVYSIYVGVRKLLSSYMGSWLRFFMMVVNQETIFLSCTVFKMVSMSNLLNQSGYFD